METNREELIELINGIKFIEKTYDVMRIVDPISNKLLICKDNKVIETDFICYHYWTKDNACDNCISLKAYKENDVFIKLEYLGDKVLMVTAIPVMTDGITLVIELIKDVSKNMLVMNKEKGEEIDVHEIINNTNELLLKDHLTGIYNRRFVDERMQVDIINNSVYKQNLSIIMADIDLFKNVNDNYGHLTGDYILKEIANILVSCTRVGKDWVARYGGEEFLVGLPNTNKERATEIAERMRKRIQDSIFEYEGIKINLTTSFGVHTIEHDNELKVETLIDFADKNLYKAKDSGRNMVISS